MSIGTIELIIDGLKQVSNDSKKNNSIKSDISIKVSSLLGTIPEDDALKTKMAIALVDFYVEKIKEKEKFTFGTKEYDAYDYKLRTWEDIIEQCLCELELKKLVGQTNANIKSNDEKIKEQIQEENKQIVLLQRKLATYFRYIGII